MQNFLTRLDLATRVKKLVHDEGTAVDTNLDQWLNEIHTDIENSWDFKWLIKRSTVTVVTSTESYNLANDFRKMTDSDAVTIDTGSGVVKLSYIPEETFNEDYYSAQSSTGLPIYYRLKGSSSFVLTQPTSASVLAIVSSSASDDTNYYVFIKGTNASGNVIYESKALNGTGSVNSANTYTTVEVITFYHVSDPSLQLNGTLTVTSNAGVVTILKLQPNEKVVGYPQILLYPIPTSTYNGKTLTYYYYRSIPNLISDYDVSIVPNHNVLIYGLQAKALAYQNDPSAITYLTLFDNEKARMIAEEQLRYDWDDRVTPEYYETRGV